MKPVSSLMKKKRRLSDIILYGLIYFFSAAILLMVLYFIAYILWNGIPMLTGAFLTTAPNPIEKTVGILPAIINTAYIIVLSLLISVPVGVGGAIYLNEYAKNKRLIRVIEFTTETLAGIPSIIVRLCLFLHGAEPEGFPAVRCADADNYGAADHHPQYAGGPQGRAEELPRGRGWPGRLQVVHHSHYFAAGCDAGADYLYYPGNRAHCGRVGGVNPGSGRQRNLYAARQYP